VGHARIHLAHSNTLLAGGNLCQVQQWKLLTAFYPAARLTVRSIRDHDSVSTALILRLGNQS